MALLALGAGLLLLLPHPSAVVPGLLLAGAIYAYDRWHKAHPLSVLFRAPVIPWLIASMAILDGLVLAAFVAPMWLLVGLSGAALTHFAQRYVRGD